MPGGDDIARREGRLTKHTIPPDDTLLTRYHANHLHLLVPYRIGHTSNSIWYSYTDIVCITHCHSNASAHSDLSNENLPVVQRSYKKVTVLTDWL